MSDSRIHLIDTKTKRSFPAAPTGTVLSSSIDLGWQGITVELHCQPVSEYPEHQIQGHRLAIMRRGKPLTLFLLEVALNFLSLDLTQRRKDKDMAFEASSLV